MDKPLMLDEEEQAALAKTLAVISPQTLVDIKAAKDWDEGLNMATKILTVYMQLQGTL